MATEALPNNLGNEQTPLGAAWRFRWLVLALTIIGTTLALLAAIATSTTEYEATASLVVTDPRTSTLFSADDVALNAARYVEDQIAILTSDTVAQRTSGIITTSGLSVDPLEIAATLRLSTADDVTPIIQREPSPGSSQVHGPNVVA